MTKSDKYMGLTKTADIKRVDPPAKSGNKHKKKEYPPHWQLRSFGLWPSKNLKGDTTWTHIKREVNYAGRRVFISDRSDDYQLICDYITNNHIDEAMDLYAKHHPETAEWPVRFINVPAIPTAREVI